MVSRQINDFNVQNSCNIVNKRWWVHDEHNMNVNDFHPRIKYQAMVYQNTLSPNDKLYSSHKVF